MIGRAEVAGRSGRARLCGVLVAVLLLSAAAPAQQTQPSQPAPAPTLLWGAQFGTPADEYVFHIAVGPDCVVVVGDTQGDLAGPNEGGWDAFIVMLDRAGQELWRRQFGTSEDDTAAAVVVDGDGNCYMAGDSDGDLFGLNKGAGDLFVVKYNRQGVQQWARLLGTEMDEWVWDIETDDGGNCYVLLATWAEGNSDDSEVVCVVKLSANGDELWRQYLGTPGEMHGMALVVDDKGHCTVTAHRKQGQPNYVLAVTLDENGRQVDAWESQIDQSFQIGNSERLAGGDSLFAGTNPGGPNAFVARFGPAGEEWWVEYIRAPYKTKSFDVVVDDAGTIYLLGQIEEEPEDTFVAILNSRGQQQTIWRLGPGAPTDGWALALDSEGNVLITGKTTGPFTGDYMGEDDIFIAKYAVPRIDTPNDAGDPTTTPTTQPAIPDSQPSS